MSDTTQMILWIVIGLVVVALIAWFLISASRRRRVEDRQRADAAALRSRVEERLPEIQDAEDRASVTAEIAQDARAEAEEKAAEAARLERHAEKHRTEAEEAVREREAMEREADRLDPDVRTDEEGHRVDRSGRRLDQPTESQTEERESEERESEERQSVERQSVERQSVERQSVERESVEREPEAAAEKADLEPAAPEKTARATAAPEGSEPEERGAFGRPGGAPGSVAAGVSLAGSAMAGAAAGRVGGPQPFPDEDDEPDLADAENPFAGQEEPGPVPVTSAHEVPVASEPQNPADEAAGGPSTADVTAPEGESVAGAAEDADWVNGPVEDVDDEDLQASAAGDTAAEDWINGPEEGVATSPADGGTSVAGAPVAGGAVAGTGAASTSDSREDDAMASDNADWVNGPVEDVDQDEIDASSAEESEAADWINGPADDEASVVRSEGGGGDGATGARGEARREAVQADETGGEQVSVPALEDTDDVLVGGGTPGDDPGDHRGQPWSTDLAADAGTGSGSGAAQGPAAPAGHAEEPAEASHVVENPGPIEHSEAAPLLDDATGTDEGDDGSSGDADASEPANAAASGAMAAAAPGSTAAAPSSRPVAERSQQPYGSDLRFDAEPVEPIVEPAGSEVPPLDEPDAAEERAASDEEASRGRRISGFEEVRDGGYGMGSAAPLEDGAQPLGHAVKGYRDSSTFVAPGGAGYDDAEPDVWFFNEEAARRAGFNPAGE